jgi:hypothetical protein
MRLPLIVALAALLCAPILAQETKPEEGFVALFDGKSLAGWQGDVKGYAVEDGAIVCQPKTGGKIFTEKEYGNFILRFDFKLTPGANNGLGIRSPLQGDPAYVGMELQILDDTAKQYEKLKPFQYHGSIYGLVASKRGHQKPVGEWNTQEVVCKGRLITVTLNGTVIVDANLDEVAKDTTVDVKAHPGMNREKGFIGFLGHGAKVDFKNIRIKELP